MPLDVGVTLKQRTKTSRPNGSGEETAGFVEAMLAHDAQQDASAAGGLDHLPGGFQVRRDGLLHLDMLAGLGGEPDRLEPEVGKCANINEIHFRMAADFFAGADELNAVPIREGAARGFTGVRTDAQIVANALVSAGMQVRDSTRTDQSNS